ncbi:MAG TPA: hypothetical protein VFQ69_03185 [Rhizomicrobium sp.]|nr:hypothetical protein [Rhizomicrobium sp.]
MRMALLALLLLASPARAADAIFTLYAEGRYEQAIRAGEDSRSAHGLAIAARAALAEAMLRPQPCLSCLERAETLARAGIAANPAHADNHVWLAAALGHQARILGKVRAQVARMPNESRAALDAALRHAPDNAYAVSALGGWNIEIVRGGGAYLARTLYGASEQEGIALFDRALKLAPGNVAVHYQVALSLLGFDADKYRARIAAELKAAMASAAVTAYERRMQDRAGELLGLQAKGADEALQARVRQYQGYPD